MYGLIADEARYANRRGEWQQDASVDIAQLYRNRNILLVKIDTEGGEFGVLNSLAEHIRAGKVAELLLLLFFCNVVCRCLLVQRLMNWLLN
jgi:hypothetical protein